jgi:ABC-type multidrug transport system ATPase subunit
MLLFLIMERILSVQNVSKKFSPPLSYRGLLSFDFKKKTDVQALDSISFDIAKGRIAGILGPNGAGKTTLLKILATLILPDQGKATICGHEVGRDDEKIKSLVGLVYAQERSFYGRLTGRQNLEFFSALCGLDKKQTEERLGFLFKLFGVDYAHRRFDTYSSGMKQKCALMRSLLHGPQVLLLDEPTKSLDYTTARQLRDFVKEKLVGEAGKTVLFTTHHMDEATEFCDYFIIMHKGKIRATGTHEELRQKTGSPGRSLGEIFIKACLLNP